MPTTVTGLTPDALTPITDALTSEVAGYATAAEASKEETQVLAEVAGMLAAVFDADSDLDATGYSENDLALVVADDTQEGDSALYRLEGAAWVFKRRYAPAWLLDWVAQEPVKNKQAARRFFSALYEMVEAGTRSHLGIAYYGDSVSPHVFTGFVDLLSRFVPIGAEGYPNPGAGTFPFLGIVTSESSGTYVESRQQTIDQDYYEGESGTIDFRYRPDGASILMQAGAVVTLGTADPGMASCMVHLAGRAGDGDVTVELTNQSMTTVIASQTVSLDGAGPTKVEFTGLTGAIMRVRITAAGGPAVICGVMFLKSYGLIPVSMGIGGSTFAQNNYGDQNIFNALSDDYKIKLFFVQAKDEGANQTDFTAALNRLQLRSDASVIICGNAPDSQTSTPDPQDMEFAAAARARDMVFLDQRRIFKSYAELSGLGWMNDGTHPGPKAYYYAGMMLLQGLGLALPWNMLSTETVRGENVQATGLQILRYSKTGYETVIRDANNGGDPGSFMAQYLRQVVFNNADGGAGPALSRYGTYGLLLTSGDSSPSQFRADGFTATDVNADTISSLGRVRVRELLLNGGTSITLDSAGHYRTRGYGASAIDDPANAVNTGGNKAAGIFAWVGAEGRPAFATGSGASDPWARVAMKDDNLPLLNASDFADASHVINTDGRKKRGLQMFDNTNEAVLVALGSAATDGWKSMVDGTVITPA